MHGEEYAGWKTCWIEQRRLKGIKAGRYTGITGYRKCNVEDMQCGGYILHNAHLPMNKASGLIIHDIEMYFLNV